MLIFFFSLLHLTAVSLASIATSTGHLESHSETIVVTLKADDYGFGLSLQGGAMELVNYPLIIANIEELGPAARWVTSLWRMYFI